MTSNVLAIRFRVVLESCRFFLNMQHYFMLSLESNFPFNSSKFNGRNSCQKPFISVTLAMFQQPVCKPHKKLIYRFKLDCLPPTMIPQRKSDVRTAPPSPASTYDNPRILASSDLNHHPVANDCPSNHVY